MFDYVELSAQYGIYEIPPLSKWIGKSIRESNIAYEYRLNILGIRDQSGQMNIMPSADYIIQETDHMMVIAHSDDINRVMRKIK